MSYQVKSTPRFERHFKKLDRPTQAKIKTWIEKNLVGCSNPRATGKPLTGEYKGLWRYRVGSYRIIAEINDGEITILLVDAGHRREIYHA